MIKNNWSATNKSAEKIILKGAYNTKVPNSHL